MQPAPAPAFGGAAGRGQGGGGQAGRQGGPGGAAAQSPFGAGCGGAGGAGGRGGFGGAGGGNLGPYVLAIVEAGTSRLLGHVGFSPLDDEVEVSYAIAEDSRGRGYGAEALRHACQWAAETFVLPSILALDAVPDPTR